MEERGDDIDDETFDMARPFLMGKAAAVIDKIKPAKEIVDEFVDDAVKCLSKGNAMMQSKAKL